jgi:hypothetical protein
MPPREPLTFPAILRREPTKRNGLAQSLGHCHISKKSRISYNSHNGTRTL